MSAPAPKVFISYRRDATSGHAGRLYDAMAARFGERNVFVDVDLDPGVDFVQRIKEAVAACQALLVIIGPRWAALADEHGAPRLADPDDFVRLEVETALRRSGVTVIPVLVAGASMPDPEDLPEGLRPLARRNALELSDMRWRYDVGRLNATLEGLVATSVLETAPTPTPATPAPASASPTPETPAAATPTAETPAKPLPSPARLFVDGMLVAGFAAFVARWLADPIDPADQVTEAGRIATAVIRQTLTWAVLGAALGVWLSFVRGEARLLANRAVLGLAIGALAGAIGGAIIAVPLYVSDLGVTREAVEAISIGAFAISGGLVGGLIGALWAPRSIAAGALAGLAAGALVRLVWNALDWTAGGAFEASLRTGGQCLLIVGLVLVALRVLIATSPPSRTSPRGAPKHRPAG